MICRLLVADHCGAGEPSHFDIPHRRLTEEELVLAVELTPTLIAHFASRARSRLLEGEIGKAHVLNPVTYAPPMPSSSLKKKKTNNIARPSPPRCRQHKHLA